MIIAAPLPKASPQEEHSFFPLIDLGQKQTNNKQQPKTIVRKNLGSLNRQPHEKMEIWIF